MEACGAANTVFTAMVATVYRGSGRGNAYRIHGTLEAVFKFMLMMIKTMLGLIGLMMKLMKLMEKVLELMRMIINVKKLMFRRGPSY